MRREVAESIIDATKRIDGILGELDVVFHKIDDDAEKRQMRRALVTLGLDLYSKITREVAKQFPDLHPDKDKM